MSEQQPPPLPVGAQVRYHGSRWGRGKGTDPEAMRFVVDGDIGTVTKVDPGQPGASWAGPEFADPIDGWSVVTFPSGADAALHHDTLWAPDEDKPYRGWYERLP